MDDAAGSSHPLDLSEQHQDDEQPIATIRRLLFAAETDRIDQLESEKSRLEDDIAVLQARLNVLQAEMAAAEARLRQQTDALASGIDGVIAHKAAAAPEEMAEALGPVMAGAIRVQERRSRDDLVDAVSPVLSEAIQVQIRDSRQSLVEALFPIIGEMAQRYIGEFFRELQRNIDARLKTGIGPQRMARQAQARLRGVAVSELEIRDALPFHVREIFVIQSGSGLLLARNGSDDVDADEGVDSDLISGMLTAVREFMHDSFGHQGGTDPMDEIQYGEQRIIIQDGRLCYLAVVLSGIEPPGFRAELRRYLNRLQAEQRELLENFSGDMSELGELPQSVGRLAIELESMSPPDEEPKPLTKGQKRLLALGGLGGLVLLALACFYLQFTLALLPLAFGNPSSTPTATASPTATATFTPTITPSSTATATATPTLTATATASPSSTPTATATALPTATIEPFAVRVNRPVWAFAEPDLASTQTTVLEAGLPVTIITYADPWLLVEWQTDLGPQRGWLSIRWVDFSGTPPAELQLTPQP
ncbi:MAG: hypothetical protein R3C43_03320 [Chloroflexota bacterium]